MSPLSPLLAYHSALRVPHNPSSDGAAPLPAPGDPLLTPSYVSASLCIHSQSAHLASRAPPFLEICGVPRSPVTRAWVPTSGGAGPFDDLHPLSPLVADGELQARLPPPSSSHPLPPDSGTSSLADYQRFLLQALQFQTPLEPSPSAVHTGNSPFASHLPPVDFGSQSELPISPTSDIFAKFSPPGFVDIAYGVSTSAVNFLSAAVNAEDVIDALIDDSVCGNVYSSPEIAAAAFSEPSKTAAVLPIALNVLSSAAVTPDYGVPFLAASPVCDAAYVSSADFAMYSAPISASSYASSAVLPAVTAFSAHFSNLDASAFAAWNEFISHSSFSDFNDDPSALFSAASPWISACLSAATVAGISPALPLISYDFPPDFWPPFSGVKGRFSCSDFLDFYYAASTSFAAVVSPATVTGVTPFLPYVPANRSMPHSDFGFLFWLFKNIWDFQIFWLVRATPRLDRAGHAALFGTISFWVRLSLFAAIFGSMCAVFAKFLWCLLFRFFYRIFSFLGTFLAVNSAVLVFSAVLPILPVAAAADSSAAMVFSGHFQVRGVPSRCAPHFCCFAAASAAVHGSFPQQQGVITACCCSCFSPFSQRVHLLLLLLFADSAALILLLITQMTARCISAIFLIALGSSMGLLPICGSSRFYCFSTVYYPISAVFCTGGSCLVLPPRTCCWAAVLPPFLPGLPCFGLAPDLTTSSSDHCMTPAW